jgi:phenylalanine-4-hydroxylase
VGSLDHPRIYGAGLLSSAGEAVHCLGPEVERVPLTAACADEPYDITRMQPRLFVARDFDQLFEVLEAFVATLSWKRGGAHGLDVAIRARTVNHVALEGGLAVTGRVAERLPAAGAPALARVAGPVLLSRGGVATGRPFAGDAVIAVGEGAVPDRGPFDLALASGLRVSGFAVGGGEVLRLRATLGGAPLDVPPWAVLAVSPSIPSVAGGPADPGAWDRWFGELSTFAAGDGEARARAHKAAALPRRLAALYSEVRALRERGAATQARLAALREEAAAFPDEWLLRAEVDELLATPGAEAMGAGTGATA